MGARWDEIDIQRGLWSVPASRMKGGREHRVPLSGRAREILETMAEARTSDFVFPGQRRSRPLSTMALEMVLRRLEVDSTVHGFRSAFRDWAAEATSAPRENDEIFISYRTWRPVPCQEQCLDNESCARII